jgi:crotonobetainyl-CoA:carnitine CoA-transferase CaiB-like acyl-CoA transferase
MTQQLLHGLRALDLTTPLGSACGRILASFGVDVVKIDAPSSPNPIELDRWRAANLGKRSMALDIESLADRERFKALAAKADFVIESFKPGYLRDVGLDYEALAVINPSIILVSISPFGQSGPYAGFKGGELIASAMGGVLITLGDPDRPPVKEALDANCFHGSAAAALGAVMAYYHRRTSGRGQHVDLSIQEAAVSRNTNNVLLYQFDKRCVQRGGAFLRFGKASIRVVWQLRDGYMFWSMASGRFGAPANRALSAWIDELGYANPMRDVDWDKYDRATLDATIRKTWEAALSRFFADRTKAEIHSEGRRRGINAAVANEVGDLLNDRQLNARNYFAQIPWSDSREVRVPRYFVRSGLEPAAPLAPGDIGANNAELNAQWSR